jgi:hypothetical protein
MEDEDPWSDEWNRMGKLGKTLNKLLVKVPMANRAAGFQPSSLRPKSGCELLPLLKKIILRFPDASRQGRGQSFKIFQTEGKRFFNAAKIKSFQLEDLRDFRISSLDDTEEPLGLMDDNGPSFRKFTTDLDKAFGIECEDGTEIDYEDPEGRGEGWEVYKAKETWTAAGEFLVWNAKVEAKLREDEDTGRV